MIIYNNAILRMSSGMVMAAIGDIAHTGKGWVRIVSFAVTASGIKVGATPISNKVSSPFLFALSEIYEVYGKRECNT